MVRNTTYPKLGKLCFQKAHGDWAKDQNGKSEFGGNYYGGDWSYAKPGPGRQLSDIGVPVLSNHLPMGIEGIVFWFQPVINYEAQAE
ncbi:hypothetical protein ACIHAA_08355 [Streptomyces sp. NPDC052040]|uniref:hypothetical protein n=1 Tax=Streptomyces sp. NPDC052040 TaxID=3365682 RepID=UPI0037CF1199